MKWKRRAIGLLNRILTTAVMSIFAGMAVLTVLMVILRYFFNSSIPGGNEALRFAFVYTTFLGAALLLGQGEHITIRLLTKRLPAVTGRAVATFGNCVVIAMHIYLIVLSLRWLAVTGGNLAEELKLPLQYIQIALPIGAALATLYAVSNTLDALFDPNWREERPK